MRDLPTPMGIKVLVFNCIAGCKVKCMSVTVSISSPQLQ